MSSVQTAASTRGLRSAPAMCTIRIASAPPCACRASSRWPAQQLLPAPPPRAPQLPLRHDRRQPATAVVCRASTSPSPSPSSSRSSPSSSSGPPGEQLPIRVALGTSASTVAEAVRVQLARYGSAQLWATSAANHFTAVQGLAEAAVALATQQHKEQPPAGFTACLALSASDQPEGDDMKRTMRKLTVTISPAPAVAASLWEPGHAAHVSANRARGVGQLVEAMGVPLAGPGGVAVVEARGEQAVTRALKAALSLQAAGPGAPLLLQPWRGPVVDVVAERRGQARTAGGLLLLFRWADSDGGGGEQQQQQLQQLQEQ